MRRGLASTRSEAQRLIASGWVVVEGRTLLKPATRIDQEAKISVTERSRYVGRGGDKLEAALRAFPVKVEGRRALDVGASTGGFTDCLLRHGATSVVAVDVGRGQFHQRLQENPRVQLWEGLDIRHAFPEKLGAPFGLIVADLSFISICLVAPALADLAEPGADLIVLVKPQFEVGRRLAGRGVVHDRSLQIEAVEKVVSCLGAEGLQRKDLIPSPVTGKEGNQEYLLWVVAEAKEE